MSKRLLNTLLVLNLALIWGNSLVSGEDSGALSGGVLAFLGRFLPVLMTETGHTLVRMHGNVPLSLMGFGLAVACIDETIQIFTPGRASSLTDVWIDTTGFALGIVVISVIHFYKTKHHLQNQKENY